MYHSITELLAESEGRPIWETVLESEQALTCQSRGAILAELSRRYDVMKNSAQKALDKALPTAGGLISGMAMCQHEYALRHRALCGDFLSIVAARALSCSEVNASMGRIVAAPTAGACGILPAVLVSIQERDELPEERVLEALLVAGGFGAVVMRNATVAGAEGGCQAECGTAAAMASAAAVYLMNGTGEQMANAFSFCLINAMGLICDPVAGLVQIPCALRNASQAMSALLSADLALAGQKSLIPADQVIEAMYETGKLMPCQLRETAQGGIAATAKSQEIYSNLLENHKF